MFGNYRLKNSLSENFTLKGLCMKPGLLLSALAMTVCALSPIQAGAWGLKTHLWIAEKILTDISTNQCAVDLNLQPKYRLPSDVCDAILKQPAAFRAGVLGPDVFPDFAVGQLTTHPGHYAHKSLVKWSTGEYLAHLLKAAKSDEEVSFAYGYLVHAAGDVFAHSYVNTYAGGIFDVMDEERRVEVRHVALEKYIEQNTPLPPTLVLNDASIKAPAQFIVDQLIFDDTLGEQYDGIPMAIQMMKMREAYQKLVDDKTEYDRQAKWAEQIEASLLKMIPSVRRGVTLKKQDREALMQLQKEISAIAIDVGFETLDFPGDASLQDLDESFDFAGKVAEHAKFRDRSRRNQLEGVQLATKAYVDVSIEVARAIINHQKSPLDAYNNWRRCWSMVYVGVPYQWTNYSCRVQRTVDGAQEYLQKRAAALIYMLPQSMQKLPRKYQSYKNELVDATLREGEKLVAAIVQDQSSIDFLKLMTKSTLTVDDLRNAYIAPAKEKDKSLLLLHDIEDLVKTDLGILGDGFQLEHFRALQYSVSLARLSMLSLDTINQMYLDQVGNEGSMFADGAPLYAPTKDRSSILPLMVKSIDGNHQWQAYGIPYPRSKSDSDAPDRRNYGYNTRTEPGFGMRLFTDPKAREKIFAVLFNGPFIGAINKHLNDPNQPDPSLLHFVTCTDNPFPVTTKDDGGPAEEDRRCKQPIGDSSSASSDRIERDVR